MAQVTDRTVGANPSGFDMRMELNNIIGALETCNSGTSEPLNTVAYMDWFDTSNATYYYLKKRNHDNTAWNTILRYTVATKLVEFGANALTATQLATARNINGISFNGTANIEIEDRLGTAIASAATTTIGTVGLGNYIHITGTTTITSFGTAGRVGIRRTLIFDGALTVTHNATSLICLGAANIVTVAGTIIEVVAETTTNWRVLSISHPMIGMLEIGYLDGVTSAIQTQINAKQSTLVSGTNIKTINSTSLLGSGDLVVSSPDATNSVKGINYKALLAEYTVSGSAVTSIDFSGLDINTHKSYTIEIELINATSSGGALYCCINGDNILTDYYSQAVYASGASALGLRQNNPQISTLNPSTIAQATMNILKINGYPRIISNDNFGVPSGVSIETFAISKSATVTNITQLTFISSITNSIGVGSKIRIYRGDI